MQVGDLGGRAVSARTYRGITEGTYWPNYTYYSYNRLNNLFRPRITYALSCFIEDHGWEAVPLYPAVPSAEACTRRWCRGGPRARSTSTCASRP
jgi:hypothetical protein